MHWIEKGFPLWLKEEPRELSQEAAHFAQTVEQVFKILDVLIDEAEAGYIIPVDQPTAYLITLFCAQKKPKEDEIRAWRVVRHGSWNSEGCTNINEWIDPAHCTMKDLPYPLPTVRVYGVLFHKSRYFATRDLKDAFRQLRMRADDASRIGYSVFGRCFRDERQPYGIASAAANCQHFAGIIIWILEQYKLPERLHGRTTVHIDDFTMTGDTEEDVRFMEKAFDALLKELGIAQSLSKAVQCTQNGKVHGIMWNTALQTANIPEDKRREMVLAISAAIWHRRITKRALEAIAGKMMHWAQLNRASKSLCYGTIHWIIKWIRSSTVPKTKWCLLPLRLVNDFKYWLRYIQCIQSVSISSIIEKPTTTVYAQTDASGSHGGVWLGEHWFAYPFHKNDMQWHITLKEAHAVVMLLHNFRSELTGKTVVVMVDNQALYHSVRRKWSPTRSVMIFVYEICLLMMEYGINLWIEWICSEINIGADALSRGDLPRFKEYAQWGQQIDEKEYPHEYYSKYRMPMRLDHDEEELNELRRLATRMTGESKDKWWMTAWEKKAIKKTLGGAMNTSCKLE